MNGKVLFFASGPARGAAAVLIRLLLVSALLLVFSCSREEPPPPPEKEEAAVEWPVLEMSADPQVLSEPDFVSWVRVSLSKPAVEDVRMDLKYSGAAIRGEDYNAPAKLMIPAGVDQAVFRIEVLPDDEIERPESIVVDVAALDYAVKGESTHVELLLTVTTIYLKNGTLLGCESAYPEGDEVTCRLIDGETSVAKNMVDMDRTFTPEADEVELPDMENSVGMKFVQIPAGRFMMGSPDNEKGRDDDEVRHEVIISRPFWMSETEVTMQQWEAVMGEQPVCFAGCGFDCPVQKVNWLEAQDFVSKLNKMEDTDAYRLPTEAEWEYAARAGTETPVPTGTLVYPDLEQRVGPNIGVLAWYVANSGGSAHPVRRRIANSWGLYDMHGNVEEWCSDIYAAYTARSVKDPQGPSVTDLFKKDGGALECSEVVFAGDEVVCRRSGKAAVSVPRNEVDMALTVGAAHFVVRGGSWRDTAAACRSANRYHRSPFFKDCNAGFRVVRNVD